MRTNERVVSWAMLMVAVGLTTASVAGFAADCEDMICGPAVACGGQGGRVEPPGPLSFCSESQQGQACEYCDGTAAIRLCATLGTGGRMCHRVAAASRTQCGAPKRGICTKATVPLTYYYCKKTTGNGTASCKSAQECDADAPCSAE